ncbi:MAG: PDDEXK nuclease domain-containing protein [Candidatus Wallbacteria bacterium]|nr:PDDEXK nuclease domain-containing protein [Candidatus Wallbacteria bacterium]
MQTPEYESLLCKISDTYARGQFLAHQAVSSYLLETYWKIGQFVVEFEQGGNFKAEYGKALLKKLAADLSLRHGRGFSLSNIYLMRQFFILFPKFQTSGISDSLTWSHYCELLNISDDMERQFYEAQCQKEKWSVRELKRQKQSSLFLRLAQSKNKKAILKLAADGQAQENPQDILRDPYVFEFLKIPENSRLNEGLLEQKLMDNLQSFLLELGKGFAFVGRQYRITLNNEHFYVDLVFYHRYLKCYVLIDLKVEKIRHHDIGQMNMYLGYFANEENVEGDNPPIGIILTREKDELLVEYSMYGMESQLFVSKYQLFLPDREELRRALEFALK